MKVHRRFGNVDCASCGENLGGGRPRQNWRRAFLIKKLVLHPWIGSIILEMIATDIISHSEQWGFRLMFKTLEWPSSGLLADMNSASPYAFPTTCSDHLLNFLVFLVLSQIPSLHTDHRTQVCFTKSMVTQEFT